MKKSKLPGRNIKIRDIAPGIWEDADGQPHFDCKALCVHFGVEPTEANIKECMDMVAAEAEKCGLEHIKRENKPDTDE